MKNYTSQKKKEEIELLFSVNKPIIISIKFKVQIIIHCLILEK